MSSADKRHVKRHKKRVMVRYGLEKIERGAYTQNLNETGMHLRTNQVYKPGTTIQLSIQFPEQTFDLWARVVWAKKVPPQLAHVVPCGMGLRYLDPPLEFLEFYERWSAELT